MDRTLAVITTPQGRILRAFYSREVAEHCLKTDYSAFYAAVYQVREATADECKKQGVEPEERFYKEG